MSGTSGSAQPGANRGDGARGELVVHRGFGLTFVTDFALQGLGGDDGGAVDVTILLRSVHDVEAAWAGREPELAWRSVFGDGETFCGRRAADGTWHLTYGREAVFLVTADARTVLCGPREPENPAWQRVLLDAVLMITSVASGFEVLHAGAVRTDAGVVAIAAESGGGKSSLVAELVLRGRPFFCDDILALSEAQDGAVAHPGPPVMNLPLRAGAAVVSAVGSVLATFGDEVWLAVDGATSDSCPLAAVFLLERGPGVRTGVSRLAPSPMHLRPHVRPSRVDRRRERRRFELLADLAVAAPVFHIRASLEVPPSGIADLLEECLQRDREDHRAA